MRERVRVAVIGVGRWGWLHAEKFALLPGAELVGVVDVDRERAQAAAAAFGAKAYSEVSELLGRVDAVSIATPTSTHYAIAKEMLEAGVDVFLEKPMTQTLEEARELEALSRSKGLILQVGHLERFNGALEGALGLIGDPRRVRARRISPFPERSLDVDVVLDLMIHDIDLLLHLLDLRVKALEVEGRKVKTPWADEARVVMETEDGRTVELIASRVASDKVREIAFSEDGRELTLDLLRHRFTLREGRRVLQGGVPRDSLREELSAFLESVRERTPARVGPSDGIRALELALRISEAIRSRWSESPS